MNIHEYKIIASGGQIMCTKKEDLCNGDYCDECKEEGIIHEHK